MDLDTEKSADKYPLHIFHIRIISIMNFPYSEGWLAGGLKTLDGLP